jgi:hypothetical protein
MKKMRSSVILAGALLGRFKKATFCCPRWLWYWSKTYRFTFKGFWKIRYKYYSKYWIYTMYIWYNIWGKNTFRFSKCWSHTKHNASICISKGYNSYF